MSNRHPFAYRQRRSRITVQHRPVLDIRPRPYDDRLLAVPADRRSEPHRGVLVDLHAAHHRRRRRDPRVAVHLGRARAKRVDGEWAVEGAAEDRGHPKDGDHGLPLHSYPKLRKRPKEQERTEVTTL